MFKQSAKFCSSKSLNNFTEDFGINAEWHFFASYDGEGPCDGVGGTLKRAAARASLQLPFDKQISNPQELYEWAVQPNNLPNIKVRYSTTADYEKATETLNIHYFKAEIITALLRKSVHSASVETTKTRKWDLLSAVCLERHPIVTKPMAHIESKFQKMLNEIEFEGSMKSDHELRMEREKRQDELQKQGLLDLDVDSSVKQTAQDLEDAGDVELAEFNFAPRITEADKKNIKNSLERKLDKCLVLLVEQKIGDKNYWLPPQGNRADGETMRQAAERILKESCGDELKVRIYGNAPMGFYKYVYPKTVREKGSHGAKVFYYLARYLNGNVPETVKHQWLDRVELEEIMYQPVHKSVSMFLVPE